MGNLTHTVSGDIASFRSAARVPIESLKCYFKPKQDLHGYSKPWPGGGGNNIWDEEWEIGGLDISTGQPNEDTNRIRSKNYIPISPNTTYYFLTANMQFVGFMYDENYTVLTWPNETTNYKIIQNASFTTSTEAKYFKFYCTASYGTTYNNDIALNYPSTVTTYSPYENICPIEGWNSLTTYQSSINIWDEEWEIGGISNTDGSNITASTTIRSKNYISVQPMQKYCCYSTDEIKVIYYNQNKEYVNYIWRKTSNTLIIPNNVYYIRFTSKSNYGNIYNNDISINYPYTDHSYHPYNGQTIPITFPVLGKNKFNPNATYIQSKTNSSYKFYKFIEDDDTYCISFIEKDSSIDISDIKLYFVYNPLDIEEGYNCVLSNGTIQSNKKNLTNAGLRRNGVTHQCKYISYYPFNDNTITRLLSRYNIQIELGSAVTTYEPYNPDNTVYGGYVDVAKGEVIATKAYATLTEPDNWGTSTDAVFTYQYNNVLYDRKFYDTSFIGLTCSCFPIDNTQQVYGRWQGFSVKRFGVKNKNNATNPITLEQLKQLTSEGKISICYDIEPITYPLSKSQLQTFLNYNNIWSNTNDITEVSYQVHDSNMIQQAKKNIMAENETHYRKVLWNQWLLPLNEDNWQQYNTNYAITTFSNGIATTEWIDEQSGYKTSIRDKTGTLQFDGQKWYVSYMIKSSTADLSWGIELCGGRQIRYIVSPPANEWAQCSTVASYYRGSYNFTYICNLSTVSNHIGIVAEVKSPILINLTAMFGFGNEPTKEEFEYLCKINNIDLTEYHPYNEGTEQIWCIPNYNTNKYNIVEWNQQAQPFSSDYYKIQNASIATAMFNNSEALSELIQDASFTYNSDIRTNYTISVNVDDILYVRQNIKVSSANKSYGIVVGSPITGLFIPESEENTWVTVSGVGSVNGTSKYIYFGRPNTPLITGDTIYSKDPMVINLTQMFGAGNEPTKTEFERLCTLNNIDLTTYQPYNTGTKMIWKV